MKPFLWHFLKNAAEKWPKVKDTEHMFQRAIKYNIIDRLGAFLLDPIFLDHPVFEDAVIFVGVFFIIYFYIYIYKQTCGFVRMFVVKCL